VTSTSSTLTVPFVDLKRQHQNLREELDDAWNRVRTRGWFLLGEELDAFEVEFAKYCGVKHCVGVSNGTDALELALRACEIGPGDEVITVSHSFIATAIAITAVGATPVFIDIDRDTYTIDVTELEQAITPKTKAVIPVHLYGQCADMAPILEIANRHGLIVIEDAAQAHGAEYRGAKAGTMGHMAAFSFYPTKNLGACGDAGAVTSNDENLERKLRLLRNYGQTKKYFHDSSGHNRRMDEIQAAILRVKLKWLDRFNQTRQAIATRYDDSMPIKQLCPNRANDRIHVFHLYVIAVNDRDQVMQRFQGRGITTAVHYPVPIHRQKPYLLPGAAIIRSSLKNTEQLTNEVLSLPMFPELTTQEIDHVSDAIRSDLSTTS